MVVEFTEFKGNKVITLKRDENDRFPFSFGKAKAKLIIQHIEEIKKFAEEDNSQNEE
ncbi:MAG: hypothetical protein QXU92_01075 [Candidatus Diapherotrites archaeon]